MTCTELKKMNLKSYKENILEALKALGKKNMALIIHGGSFPSATMENTGFGSPYSNGARNLINFCEGLFNNIQLGPAGKTKLIDASPYTGTVFSINPLFIDIVQLKEEKWANLLGEEDIKYIVGHNPNKDSNFTAYLYAFEKQEEALRKAFSNFTRRLFEKNKYAKKIEKEFKKFRKENADWLEKDSIYEVLSIKHSSDYWPSWADSIDKNLYNAKSREDERRSRARIKVLKEQYSDEIEFYCFCQFIADKQMAETIDYALSKGIKFVADRQVALSDRDVWANQSLFLDGWYLGCPPDYFSEDGQAWGFPVLNPEMMFDKRENLKEGGILLKSIFKKMFRQNPGGVRIDHIIGLIDPWVYKKGCKPKSEEGAGRLFSSPEHPELAKFAITTMKDLNEEYSPDHEKRVKSLNKKQIQMYGRIIEKIVIKAAKEEGVSKDSIICEDLGTLTYPVECVMKEYNLRGMRLTQFVKIEEENHPYRGRNIEKDVWAMVGTHDNEPLREWAEKLKDSHEAYLHAKNLSEDLNVENKDEFIVSLTPNPDKLFEAKFTELFASKAENIQIFFSDFWGIEEVYNKPGTSGSENWSLRLPDNFEEFYYQQLENEKALNLAKILALAIKARGLDKKYSELVTRLESF